MATAVVNREELVLQDGSKVEVGSLNIKNTRRVLKAWESVTEIMEKEDQFALYDLLTEMAIMAMEQFRPDEKYTADEIEELFDLSTMYRFLDVAASLNLEKMFDPKLAEQLIQEQLGQN